MGKRFIVYGEQGVGKAAVAQAVADAHGLSVLDGWDGQSELPDAVVAVTNVWAVPVPGAMVVHVWRQPA